MTHSVSLRVLVGPWVLALALVLELVLVLVLVLVILLELIHTIHTIRAYFDPGPTLFLVHVLILTEGHFLVLKGDFIIFLSPSLLLS